MTDIRELRTFIAACFRTVYDKDNTPFHERGPWNIIFETAQQFPETTLHEFMLALRSFESEIEHLKAEAPARTPGTLGKPGDGER